MGRRATGAECCEESKRIELSYLLRKKYLDKGEKRAGKINWTCRGEPSGNIWLYAYWTETEKYIRLLYTLTDRSSGETIDYDYQIQLVSVPSNLGKGEVLYFLCPESGKRCRILYCAYGYHKWKSREAYSHRLYYQCQTASKLNYANDRYWAIKRRLERLEAQPYHKRIYQGSVTRTAIRRQWLSLKKDQWDWERWLCKVWHWAFGGVLRIFRIDMTFNRFFALPTPF